MSRRLHRCGFWIPQIGSLVLVWSVLAAVAPAGANSVVPVEVKRVVDGDTIEVLLSGKREKVRLLSVDAPESDQEFGKEARNALREFAEGKTGVLRLANNRDQYNRLLGSLTIEGQDAGLYLIENGYAWFFKAYGGSVPQEWRTAYEMAQANAKYEPENRLTQPLNPQIRERRSDRSLKNLAFFLDFNSVRYNCNHYRRLQWDDL